MNNLISYLNKHSKAALFVLLVFWTVTYAWRPFVLGFYSDSFGVLLSSSKLQSFPSVSEYFYIGSGFNHRFIFLWLYDVVGFLVKENQVVWHYINGLFALVISAQVFFLSKQIMRKDEKAGYVSLFVACLWLVLPWAVPAVSWATMWAHNVMYIFLVSYFSFSLKFYEQGSKKYLLFSSLSLFASYFFGEYYFLQWAAVIPFVALLSDAPLQRRNIMKMLLSAATVQSVFVVINRLSSVKREIFPQFHLRWIQSFTTSFVETLASSVWEMIPFFVPLFVALIYVVFKSTKSAGRQRDWLVLTGVIFFGIMLAQLPFALTGYTLNGRSVMARPTALSLWFVVFFAVSYLFLVKEKHRKQFIGLLAGIVFSFTVSTVLRVNDWRVVHLMQTQFMNSLPVEQLKQLSDSALVFYSGMGVYEGVQVNERIGEYIRLKYPEIKVRIIINTHGDVVARDGVFSQYGAIYSRPSKPIHKIKYTELYHMDSSMRLVRVDDYEYNHSLDLSAIDYLKLGMFSERILFKSMLKK